METAAQFVRRQKQRRKRLGVVTAVVLGIIVVLAIVIPCALLLPSAPSGPVHPSSILLPLYIYPTSEDAWNPLYEAIQTWPSLKFTIIINPNSGPTDRPSEDFIAAVKQLHDAPNARLVGYVPTDYTSRDISAVLQDVATYSSWSKINSALTMDGIFFDETPSDYSAEKAQYLSQVNRVVKQNSSGINKPKLTIHNPGTMQSPRLDVPLTDVTVAFESSYGTFENQRSALKTLTRHDRSAYSFMVHSVPEGTDLGKLVHTMSRDAEHIFLTTAEEGYYEKFSDSWAKFTEIMAS